MAGRSIFKKRIAFVPKKKEKPSAYSTWKKNEKTGILEAICARCHRKFVAYHASQLHMVAPSTGDCYYCRSHMHEQTRKPRANDAVCDERLFSDIERAHQGRWLYDSKQLKYSIESSPCFKKIPLPHWSCCYGEERMPSKPANRCTSAEGRSRMTKKAAADIERDKFLANRGIVKGRAKLLRGLPSVPTGMMGEKEMIKDVSESSESDEGEGMWGSVDDIDSALAGSVAPVDDW
jgi:hypothetical protein|eukprot:Stramenopile-MAST_4_protein_2636